MDWCDLTFMALLKLWAFWLEWDVPRGHCAGLVAEPVTEPSHAGPNEASGASDRVMHAQAVSAVQQTQLLELMETE